MIIEVLGYTIPELVHLINYYIEREGKDTLIRTVVVLEARIKELDAENARITDAYKDIITRLNPDDRSGINITP